jgi:hypothetical protein
MQGCILHFLKVKEKNANEGVDDPTGRVDKAMDEMLITKRCYQHYRPQPCPHFTHIQLILTAIIINDIILNK